MMKLTYQNITQEKVNELCAMLLAHGSQVQNQGNGINVISGHGIKAIALYVAATETLTITVSSKPFFISESVIESGINEALGIQPVALGAPVVMIPKPESESK
jgi:hypothetical protein